MTKINKTVKEINISTNIHFSTLCNLASSLFLQTVITIGLYFRTKFIRNNCLTDVNKIVVCDAKTNVIFLSQIA